MSYLQGTLMLSIHIKREWIGWTSAAAYQWAFFFLTHVDAKAASPRIPLNVSTLTSTSRFACLSPLPQLDVRSGRPGRQVLEPPGHHDYLLLPLDHLCGGGGGHRHGLHHPSGRGGSEGGLRGQQEADDQLRRRPAGSHPVSHGSVTCPVLCGRAAARSAGGNVIATFFESLERKFKCHLFKSKTTKKRLFEQINGPPVVTKREDLKDTATSRV